ncbi:(d)CMP kinase [[Acholeplasma] multilocale]|uniref:(d)CMP kinase n=1 Tax=[Acholeplasma] multilocale TaxID=264638 RepID=UPI00047C0546|nr:(d)CMP kinase [[Acholeplasma] multilocale]
MSEKIIVAVDGTSGSGKTATFKAVADEVGYELVDTGLMYRAFTLLALQEKINLEDKNEIINLLDKFDYQVKDGQAILNGEEVTERLQENDIVKYINFVTIVPEVREVMVQKMRDLVIGGGYIELGRDITSIVLPNADLKIYLDSSVEVRAERRHKQNLEMGITDQDYEGIKQAIIKRDDTDKNRTVGPLVQTEDSWYIDNSSLEFDEVVKMIVEKIKEKEGK